MKRLIGAAAVTLGLLPVLVAPTFAGPTMPTYAVLMGVELEVGQADLAVSLSSPDHRCVLNRTVKFQESRDLEWVTLATDTTAASEVAAVKVSLTTGFLQVQVPSRKLSDGTVCAGVTTTEFRTERSAAAVGTSSARGPVLPEILFLADVRTIPTTGRKALFGHLEAPKKCRSNRVVKLSNATLDGYQPAGRDTTTGSSGAFGIGGEIGELDPDFLTLTLVKKTLADGTVCSGETLTLGEL